MIYRVVRAKNLLENLESARERVEECFRRFDEELKIELVTSNTTNINSIPRFPMLCWTGAETKEVKEVAKSEFFLKLRSRGYIVEENQESKGPFHFSSYLSYDVINPNHVKP